MTQETSQQTTIYDLDLEGMVAEVHYTPGGGVTHLDHCYQSGEAPPTHNVGMLTIQIGASHYGLPVWVAGANRRLTDDLVLAPGQAYAPADLPARYVIVLCPDHHMTTQLFNAERVQSAGYLLSPADD